VLFDQMSTRYFRLRIEWKVPEWGIDEFYLDREGAICTPWNDDELKVLEQIYPNGSQEEILQALPRRSWASIRGRATKLHVRKLKNAMLTIDSGLSWNDLQFLGQCEKVPVGKWGKVS
jgi:hypothetical protein